MCNVDLDENKFYTYKNVGYSERLMKRCKKCYNSKRRVKKKTGINSLTPEQKTIYDDGLATGKKKSDIFRELTQAGFTRKYTTLCNW